MIPQQFIEEVQQRTDIVDLISNYIPLKRMGRNFKAPCPFHSEKTPSFFVSPQKQIFHCFGCGEGGGALQFLMLYDKLSFTEAVELLAKRLGMQMPSHKAQAKDKMKSLFYEAAYQASQFFHNNLISLKEAKVALNYLERREITRDMINTFKLGFALGRNTLLDYMRKKGFTLEILEKTSLVTPRRGGGYIDLFRDRIIFPIYDVRHRVIGFGARAIRDDESIPKYINSFENPLYSKREHLFGLNLSKDEILKKDSVIVTEGYSDMIVPYWAGIKNIVASLGTALTLEQIRLIKRYTKNVILVFDADKAGQAAALRALDLILENGLKAKILTLPRGFDLDLAIRKKGLEFVSGLLKETADFFDYKTGVLKRLYDVESIEGKVKIAGEVLATIDKLTSEIEKYEYIKKLAVTLKVKEELLIAELRKLDGQSKIYRPSSLTKMKDPAPMAEKLVIKFIFASDKARQVIERRLQKDDFSHPLSRKAFSFILEKYKLQNKISSHNFLSLIEDKEMSSFISRILMEDTGKLDKDVLKDCIGSLKSKRAKALREELRNQIREAEKDKNMIRVRELMVEFRKINSEV